MAAGETRGHTSSTHGGVVFRDLRETRHSLSRRRILENSFHVRSDLTRLERAHARKIGPGYRVECKREGVGLQTGERIGNVINGIVGPRLRTVAAGIRGRELIVAVELFARPYIEGNSLAIFRVDSSRVGIENERRVDEVAVVLQQPVDAIRFPSLLVGGKSQNEVAIGLES